MTLSLDATAARLDRSNLLRSVPSPDERAAGTLLEEAILLHRLVTQAVTRLEPTAALDWCEAALLLTRDMFGSPFVGLQLAEVSWVLATNGGPRAAARLHGAVMRMETYLSGYELPAQRRARAEMLDALRATLGHEALEGEVSLGLRMSTDAAIGFALEAVRTCRNQMERMYSAPGTMAGTSSATVPPSVSTRAGIDRLTERQRDVLALLATGASNKDIARQLSISVKTVMHHTVAIYRELAVRGRSEAVAVAYRCGLAPASSSPRR